MYCIVWSEVMSRMVRNLWNKAWSGPHPGAGPHLGLSLWKSPIAAPQAPKTLSPAQFSRANRARCEGG